MSEYTSDMIVVLKGLEAVRRRPGMYVGDTNDGSGLHDLLWEVVANVIDQHLGGGASELRVELGANHWLTVRDDGGGIPVEPVSCLRPMHVPDADEPDPSVLEVVLTTLHHGPTYDHHVPHVHVGSRYGIGLAAVNALSARLVVETTRDGVRWTQAYERGEPVTPLRRLGPTTVDGTLVRLLPDHDIFSSIALDPDLVRARLEELAWLNPHLRVFFQERRLRARGGVLGWARQVAAARGTIATAFGMSHVVAGVRVDIGFAWNKTGEPITRAFVNMREAPRGTHVDALWPAFATYAQSGKAVARRRSTVREALERGMVAMIHVGLYDPRFGTPTHDQLVNPEAKQAVEAALAAYLASGSSWHVRRFLDERLGVPR